MNTTDIESIRTLGEFLPPDVIERWIKEEKKKPDKKRRVSELAKWLGRLIARND